MTDLDERERCERAILLVDDEEGNVRLLREILELDGYTRVETQTDPAKVRFGEPGVPLPDLAVVDLHTSGVDGLEVLRRLTGSGAGGDAVPVIVLSADVSEETKRRALALGARDFLAKPFDRVELLLRVRNVLQVQQLEKHLRAQNVALEDQVLERTRALEIERFEMIDRLALAVEFRDDDTNQHARRIGRNSGMLGKALGLDGDQVELIRRAAPLHDIGKLGVADAILRKPGKLTDAEFEEIKWHTIIGATILSGGRCPLVRLSCEIALTHHERWDGTGYPRGLQGNEIPLGGRIVAVADVFDALTHTRPYKAAWPVDDAVAEVLSQAGRQFDPRIVDAFSTLNHRMLVNDIDDALTPTALLRADRHA